MASPWERAANVMRRQRAARTLKRKQYPDTPPVHPKELKCPRCEHSFQCTDDLWRHTCVVRGDGVEAMTPPPSPLPMETGEDSSFPFYDHKALPRWQYPGLPEDKRLANPALFDHMFRHSNPLAPVHGVDTGVPILTETLAPLDRSCMVMRELTPDQRRAREIHEADARGHVLTLSPGGGSFTFNGGAVAVGAEGGGAEAEIMVKTEGAWRPCE